MLKVTISCVLTSKSKVKGQGKQLHRTGLLIISMTDAKWPVLNTGHVLTSSSDATGHNTFTQAGHKSTRVVGHVLLKFGVCCLRSASFLLKVSPYTRHHSAIAYMADDSKQMVGQLKDTRRTMPPAACKNSPLCTKRTLLNNSSLFRAIVIKRSNCWWW